MIPDEKVREVRERASIFEVISEYVGLKKSGVNYLGLCPFHTEKTPSFNVNPAKGIYHCFGCGVGGDVVSFIMRIEGMAFPEAVRFLARRVGVEIPDRPQTDAEKRRSDEREHLYEVHETAVRYYEKVLLEEKAGEPGRAYLRRRAVDGETARAYRLGFAPDSWDGLARYLERKRIPLEEAEKIGLLRKRDRGGYYDGFRNRLLFPITDLQGRPIGFGGRVLDDSLPKYLNSPESPIYRKSDVLFGMGTAKHAIREKGEAFIVEGYFDHLALFRAGFRNVVATCGTALTESHLKLLKRFAGKALLLFDADKAGKKATLRAMELFLEAGFPASVVQMPPDEDPDTFLERYGVEAFSRVVGEAKPVFEFFFRDLCRQHEAGSVEGKVAILSELAPRLDKIADQVERDLYVREVARVLAIEESDVRRKVRRTAAPGSPAQARVKRVAGAEEMLLSLMGKYTEIVHLVADFGPERIFSPALVPMAEEIVSRVVAGDAIDWSEILDRVVSGEERSRLAALLVEEDHLEAMDVRKAFEQCCQTLEKIALKEIRALRMRLAQTDPDSDEFQALLKRIDSLRARKSRMT
jgi:DNA primase